MRFQHRITTIYRKELIDILRDHRTLIAMIVVPIVLYPLLMLGSVQAVSFQAETLRVEAITIGVVGDEQRIISKTAFQKRYRKPDGEWGTTYSLDVHELPKAILVLQKAYEYLVARETEDTEPQGGTQG